MKYYTEEEKIEIELGKCVGLGKPLICPICSSAVHGEQLMSSTGGFENELFCPHCDLRVNLVIN